MPQSTVLCGFLIILFIGGVQSDLTETSKACYGAWGLTCTSHTLSCTNGTIAVSEAYYTDNTECPRTGIATCLITFDNIPETGNHYEFSDDQRNSLYSNCSFKRNCSFTAGRRGFRQGFSVVKYRCIQNSVDTCSSLSNQKTDDVSLVWKGNVSAEELSNCKCAISTTSNNVDINIYALDIRLNKTQQSCSDVVIDTADAILEFNCLSQFLPHQLIDKTSLSRITEITVNIRESYSSDLIWIRVQGSTEFQLNCFDADNSMLAETTAVISTSKMIPSSPTSRCTTDTEITPLTANNSFPGGIFMAGVCSGALTVIVIVLVVYLVVIKRRCDITVKKQDGVPPVEHPYYSDLSASIPANTYDALTPDVATYANDSITVDERSREHENA